MRIGTVLLQLLIAFVLAATFVPVILVLAPSARDPVAGPALGGGLLLVFFGVVWLVWPRSRR
jgi:hypothetical protein